MSVSFGLPFSVIVDLALKFIIHNISMCKCVSHSTSIAIEAHTRCEKLNISIYYDYSDYFAVRMMFIMLILLYASIRSMWFAFGISSTFESKQHIYLYLYTSYRFKLIENSILSKYNFI